MSLIGNINTYTLMLHGNFYPYGILRNLNVQKHYIHTNFSSNWSPLQIRRRRWFHVQYPPLTSQRSAILKLHKNYSKLFFICNGWSSHLNTNNLEEKHMKRLRILRQKTIPIDDRKIKKKFVQDGLYKVNTPCLVFAKTQSHQLIETLSLKEVNELENLAPIIKSAFLELESRVKDDEKNDLRANHKPLTI